MREVNQALSDVRNLFQEVLGQTAPEIEREAYLAFPPGVDPIHHAMGEVEQLKRFKEQLAATPEPVQWIPRADSFLSPRDFIVRLEIPGVARDDLKVLMAGGECVVAGKRARSEIETEIRPLSIESESGRFERRFTLPPGSHPDKLSARYAEGVLEIRVPIDVSGPPKEMDVELS